MDVISALGALALFLFTYMASIYLGLRTGNTLDYRTALRAAFKVAKLALGIWIAMMVLLTFSRPSVSASRAESYFVAASLFVITLAAAMVTVKEVPPLRKIWLAPWLLLLYAGWWVIGFYCSTPHPLLWYVLNK